MAKHRVLDGEPDGGDVTKRIRLIGIKNVGEDVYQIGSVSENLEEHTMVAYLFGSASC